jgi:hypothetical protein
MSTYSGDAEALLDAFESGALVRPSHDALNAVDLALAMASVSGASTPHRSAGQAQIEQMIGPAPALVFIAIDGLGMNFIETLPEDAFLRRNLATVLNAPFPSTTSVSFATYATGLWPADHGITSWYVHLAEIDGAATILPFVRRSDLKPLGQLGVDPAEIWPHPALTASAAPGSVSVMPEAIARGPFTRYQVGNTSLLPYNDGDLRHGLSVLSSALDQGATPTRNFLYHSLLDSVAHLHGVSHTETLGVLQEVNSTLEEFADGLDGRARVVVSSDHGHLDANPDRVIDIGPSGGPGGLLRVPASGDFRVAFFHVDSDKTDRFATVFQETYGEVAILLSVDEVDSLHLFGPGPLAPLTRERIGEWMGISRGSTAFAYDSGPDLKRLASGHSGLSPQEMKIPLILF